MIDQIQKSLGQIDSQQKKPSKASLGNIVSKENVGNSIVGNDGDSAEISKIVKSENSFIIIDAEVLKSNEEIKEKNNLNEKL